MDINQEAVVHFLSASIRCKKVDDCDVGNINWKRIFEISKEQEIYTILYPKVKKLNNAIKSGNEIMYEWRRRTILASLNQKKNINRMSCVLKKFNQARISSIALKGLVIREFYPIKELRTMADSDILIHIEDLEKVKRILLNMGYFQKHKDSKHVVFLHKQYLPIEVHWLLIDKNYFTKADYLEKDVWKNIRSINMCGTNVSVPSIENQILYLCLHMAVHFVYSGFGLRQLSDLVLLVESERNKIDWDIFYKKIKKCKIENFVIVLFEACRRLFTMDVPDVLYNKKLENSQYVDMIIHNVFSRGVYGGIYGKASMNSIGDNLLMSYCVNNGGIYSYIARLKYIIKFLFPRRYKLSKRYGYVKGHRAFIPIAWLHRLIYGFFRKDFNMKQKILFLLTQADFLREQEKLFKWLEL